MFFSNSIAFVGVFLLFLGVQLQSQELLAQVLEGAGTTEKFEADLDNKVIKSVRISGKTSVSKERILSYLEVKKGKSFNQLVFGIKVKSLKNFFNFKIAKFESKVFPDGVEIDLYVEDMLAIKNILFVGNTLFSRENLLPFFSKDKSGFYNMHAIRDGLQDLKRVYLNQGYFKFEILRVENPENADGHVIIYLSEGILDDIVISGNLKTKSLVILRELKLRQGMVVNSSSLQLDVRRVYNLGFFKTVQPKLTPSDSPGKWILTWVVDETLSRGAFTVGGSYSPLYGLSLLSNIEFHNLWGTGRASTQ